MATSSTSSSPTSPTFVIANISNLVSIKLDRGNYLLWRQQFLSVLFAHDLMGYTDGSKECPSKFIKNADGTITDTVDSSFLEWMKQDRHLLSWIQATLTEGVLAQVVGLQTSRDVWVALERRYASLSRAHISQLTTQLQIIKKGGMTIIDYMNRIKTISDNLAAVGKSIHDDDLIHHIVHVKNYFWRNDVNFNLPSIMNLPPSLHKIILSKTILAPIMAEGAILTMAGDVEEDVVVMAAVEAKLYVTTTQMQTRLQAMVATTSPSADQTWYADTGATNNLTYDLSNLTIRTDYQGSDKISVGNGQGLRILHTGSSTLHTSS
uniref:Uncharacterized protein n=1 Tax=Ananas comosus var. bracteatus TaxID=296719 RepID=A0A6V7NFC7_ANACO|nr:unnamed protein product [Ananas comosus var. bracteatus]